MLEISKSPTNREGKPANAATIEEAKTLMALSGICPALEEAIQDASTPAHRKACVQLLRRATSESAALDVAKLLNVGNTSAFLQKFRTVFVLTRGPESAVASLSHEERLRALGLEPEETE